MEMGARPARGHDTNDAGDALVIILTAPTESP